MPTNVQAQEFLQSLSPFAFTPAKKQQEQKVRAENEKSEQVVRGLGAQLLSKVRIIDTNISRVATALGRVVTALSSQLDRKAGYNAEEAQMEAVRQQAVQRQQVAVREEGPGVGSILKSIFTNPVFLGALATVAYNLLPEDAKKKFRIFFGTLGDELGIFNMELSKLHPAIKAAGIAIATYFTVPLISSLGNALANVIRLSKLVGTILLPKGAGAVARTVAGAVVLGGAAVAGVGAVKQSMSGKEGAQGGGNAGDTAAGPGAAGAQKTAGPGVAASSESADIKKYTKFNSSVDIDGLDNNFKNKFAAMAKEYEERTGRKIQVNSAYRSSEKQAALYKKLGPGKASKPGNSLHEKGLAIDIQSADANKLAGMGLLDKYGFTRPYNREPWHIEFTGASKGGTEDNPLKPGAPIPTVGKGEEAVDASSGATIGAIPESVKQEESPAPSGSSMEMEGFGSPYGAPSASLEPSKAAVGDQIAALSTSVESKYSSAPSNNIMPINNSKTSALNLEQTKDDPPPVPNPVANRGSLGLNTTHSTAYG